MAERISTCIKNAEQPNITCRNHTDSETVVPRSSSLITVKIPLQYLKGAKQIIVAQGDDEPVMLPLAATPNVPDPVIDKQAQVPVGNTGTIKLSGSNFLSVA